jgi:putative membrane protein
MTDTSDWEKLQIDEPLVRDVMAIERTTMANDRTFLAFWRTALTMFIAGLTFTQFFAGTVFQVIGWIFVPTGVAVFIHGVRVYRRMNKRIVRAEKSVEDETTKKQIPKPKDLS